MEAQADHRQILVGEAALGAGDLFRRHAHRGLAFLVAEAERQRRLRQHRRHDRRLGHHRQREIAREAHADRAHAPAAAFAFGLARQRAQPVDDRAGFVGRPDVELATDADALEHLAQAIERRRRPAGMAEQAGQEDRHPGGRDVIGEAHHQRVHVRHFVDHDHAGSAAAPPDRPVPAAVAEIE